MNTPTAQDIQADAQARILALKRELKTWDAVAAKVGYNKGALNRMVNGRRHVPDRVLVSLGLIEPFRTVKVSLNRKPRVKRGYKVSAMRRLARALGMGAKIA